MAMSPRSGAVVALCAAMLLMVTLSAGEAGETHMLDAQDPVAQRQEAQKEDDAEQNKEAAKQGDTHNQDGRPETEASAKPDDGPAASAQKVKHVKTHAKHKEVHSKATDKVKELEAKLGIRHLPKASALQVNQEYAKYNTDERNRKRKARFPAPQNKEQAVKRMYEIMHKNKQQNFQRHAAIQGSGNFKGSGKAGAH